MDTFTGFVMSVSRAWWGTIAAWMQICALGLPMFAWAMVDTGWPWLVAVAFTVGGVFLAYLAEGVKTRYLKWAQMPDPNGSN